MKSNNREDIRSKRDSIVSNATTTLGNWNSVKKSLSKTRQGLNEIEGQIDNSIPYLQRMVSGFTRMPDDAFINPTPEFVNAVGTVENMARSAKEQSESVLQRFSNFEQEVDYVTASTMTGSTAAVASGTITLDAARIIEPEYPEMKVVVEELKIPLLPDRTRDAEQLLSNMAPQLRDRLLAAWQAYRDSTRVNRCGEGSLNLRELIREFLEILAPDDRVEIAPWFKVETQDGNPTRRQRVKFAIQGNRKDDALSDTDLGAIDQLMSDTRDMIDKLNKLAHKFGDSPERLHLLHSSIISTQEIATEIVKLRQSFFEE